MKHKTLTYTIFYFLIIWTIFGIFIQIITSDYSNVLKIFNIYSKFSDKDILEIVTNKQEKEEILYKFLHLHYQLIHFYNLPKRIFGTSFSEVTSANRDGRYPLASDFTFFTQYGDDWVTLLEDYGCGCVFRLYLYPPLATDMSLYKMTPANLTSMYIQMQIDGYFYEFSLQDMAEANKFPFVHPISSQFSCPVSGISGYSPFCYNKSMIIKYKHNKRFPEELYKLTVNCSLNELRCPVKMYSGISKLKYPAFTKCSVKPFYSSTDQFKTELLLFNKLLTSETGIEADNIECLLKCQHLFIGKSITIFQSNKPEVINLLRFTTLRDNVLLKSWGDILLTIHLDNEATPNINRIPLSALFGSRPFKGAAFGRKTYNCNYMFDENSDFHANFEVGYLFFPLPFWKTAKIKIEYTGLQLDLRLITVCYQISTTPNYYDIKTSGSLVIKRTNYDGEIEKTRQILKLNNTWGHIVSLLVEIENLRPNLKVPYAATWAALQSDILIYVDDSRTPVAMGTGLEDYFSYAHGFANAENTSFSFVGLHHSYEKHHNYRKPVPITRHCYRQHILDPVVFTRQIEVVMEGMDGKQRTDSSKSITQEQFERLKQNGDSCFAYTIIYYVNSLVENAETGGVDLSKSRKPNICFHLRVGDKHDRKKFHFKSSNKLDLSLNYTLARFVGDVSARTYTGTAAFFKGGDSFSFSVPIPSSFKSSLFTLRRTYYCGSLQSSSSSLVTLNEGRPQKWFLRLGCLNQEFALLEEELNFKLMQNTRLITIKIEQLEQIYDVSYTLCQVP